MRVPGAGLGAKTISCLSRPPRDTQGAVPDIGRASSSGIPSSLVGLQVSARQPDRESCVPQSLHPLHSGFIFFGTQSLQSGRLTTRHLGTGSGRRGGALTQSTSCRSASCQKTSLQLRSDSRLRYTPTSDAASGPESVPEHPAVPETPIRSAAAHNRARAGRATEAARFSPGTVK